MLERKCLLQEVTSAEGVMVIHGKDSSGRTCCWETSCASVSIDCDNAVLATIEATLHIRAEEKHNIDSSTTKALTTRT